MPVKREEHEWHNVYKPQACRMAAEYQKPTDMPLSICISREVAQHQPLLNIGSAGKQIDQKANI